MNDRKICRHGVSAAVRELIGRIDTDVVKVILIRYRRVGLQLGIEAKDSDREVILLLVHLPGCAPVGGESLDMRVGVGGEAGVAQPPVREAAIGAGFEVKMI